MPAPRARRALKTRRGGSTAVAIADLPVAGGAGSVTSGDVEIAPGQIALLAYSYWEARGCQGGSPEEDWLRAERQLRAGK